MTELTLYHCVSARSFRVLWALEELDLDYRLVTMAFPPRLHDKTFFQINPLGTVPALVDDNGVLTESAAICEYLSQVYGNGALSVNRDEANYGQYLNWLSAADATLTFPQTLSSVMPTSNHQSDGSPRLSRTTRAGFWAACVELRTPCRQVINTSVRTDSVTPTSLSAKR